MTTLLLLGAASAAGDTWNCTVTKTLGCYKDNTDAGGKRILPALNNHLTEENSMEACAAACHDSGLSDSSLIGVEYGGQCFCGDSFSVPNPTKAPDADCQKMKCPDGEGCGFNNRLLVYLADCKKQAPTPAPPTPPTPPPTPNYMPCTAGSPGEKMPFCDHTKPVADRVKDLIGRMSMDEKCAMVNDNMGGNKAVPSVGWNGYNWNTECLHGRAKQAHFHTNLIVIRYFQVLAPSVSRRMA